MWEHLRLFCSNPFEKNTCLYFYNPGEVAHREGVYNYLVYRHLPAAEPTPRFPWATREGRARKGRGAGRCEVRCGGRAAGFGAGLRGPGGARLPRLATTAAAAVFMQLTLR